MRFLSSTEQHDLIESDRFWMLGSKDANPIKLACQQSSARAYSRRWNNEHQHALAGHPAIAVFQEHQFHPLITVLPELAVIWRIEVQKRAGFCQFAALEWAAVDGRNSFCSRRRSSVRIEFNAGETGAGIFGDFD